MLKIRSPVFIGTTRIEPGVLGNAFKDGRLLAVCWSFVGRLLAVCWSFVGRLLVVQTTNYKTIKTHQSVNKSINVRSKASRV